MTKSSYDPRGDPMFQRPVIDIDEWRMRFLPDGTELPYRYLHGSFEGTAVRFSILFPEKDRYALRFHHYLSPVPRAGAETKVQEKSDEGDMAAFALASGAYFVESNMGSGVTGDPEMPWKASAAVAEYSKVKAAEIYGPGKSYGYVYGGRGGAYQAMACIENAAAWDGAAMILQDAPAILCEADPSPRFLLSNGAAGVRQALTELATWVENGVKPDVC